MTDSFLKTAEDPSSWLMQAQLLMRSAFLLLSQHEISFTDAGTIPRQTGGRIIVDDWKIIDHTLHFPIMMLAGMALESIFKGAIIKKGDARIQKGKRFNFGLDPKGHGHELLPLAKKAGISLSVDDEELLIALEQFIRWKGRYPVSWDRTPYDSPDVENFGGTHVSGFMESIEDLYHRARSMIFPGCGRIKWR